MQSHFKAVRHYDKKSVPSVGNLVKSSASPSFINIVLGVSKLKIENVKNVSLYCMKNLLKNDCTVCHAIRSVRYAVHSNGNATFPNSTRSRSFIWEISDWVIVEEFRIYDNSASKEKIISSLKGIQTAWIQE